MTAPWTIRLPLEQAGSLSRLFDLPCLRVCEVADEVWVRGDSVSESSDLALRSIADGVFFWIETDGAQLRLRDARVPSTTLPQGEWLPIAQWLRPELPASLWPGELADSAPRVSLRLIPSEEQSEPNVLLTTRSSWAAYAVAASQVRLDRWRFALAADGRALIRGEPLPPLAGERFVERDGIVVLAGWTWAPQVDAGVIRDVFGLGQKDIVLWSNQVCEIVRGEQFVAASRSGVRMSEE